MNFIIPILAITLSLLRIDMTNKKKEVVQWAKSLLALPQFCILDTETTGIDNNAEIVEIAILDKNNQTLLNQLVKPTEPITKELTGIHGITNEEVKKSPSFKTVWPKVRKVLKENQPIIVYNSTFDTRLIIQSCQKYGTTPKLDRFKWNCAMEKYSQFFGEWSDYWGNWKWQKLISAARWASNYLDCDIHGAHRALNDCRNTLLVLQALSQYTGKKKTRTEKTYEKFGKTIVGTKNDHDLDSDIPF